MTIFVSLADIIQIQFKTTSQCSIKHKREIFKRQSPLQAQIFFPLRPNLTFQQASNAACPQGC